MCCEVSEGVWVFNSMFSGALLCVVRCLKVSGCIIVCLKVVLCLGACHRV